jgi:hypothetical protein
MSLQTIATKSGLSVSTVQTALRHLRRAKLIGASETAPVGACRMDSNVGASAGSAFALEVYENLGHSHTLFAAEVPYLRFEHRLPRRAQAIP